VTRLGNTGDVRHRCRCYMWTKKHRVSSSNIGRISKFHCHTQQQSTFAIKILLHCQNAEWSGLRFFRPVTSYLKLPVSHNGHRRFTQECRAVAWKPHDAPAVLFGFKFADNIRYKCESSQAPMQRVRKIRSFSTDSKCTADHGPLLRFGASPLVTCVCKQTLQ